MPEQELVKKLEEVLEPIQKAHQEFLVKVMDTVNNAFHAGIDVGKELQAPTTPYKQTNITSDKPEV